MSQPAKRPAEQPHAHSPKRARPAAPSSSRRGGGQAGPSRARPVAVARNARHAGAAGPSGTATTAATTTLPPLRPARSMANYIEYDLSAMTDSKGGFIAREDDPDNRALAPRDGSAAALAAAAGQARPAHMSEPEWERHLLLERLRAAQTGPFRPGGANALDEADPAVRKCRECGGADVDPAWIDVFDCAVCGACKRAHPDKYSLLTKTEVRADYLITDSELRDEKLLRRLEKPNPHKQHWTSMLLFLRYQVEEYAFGPRKWKSPQALDDEYERRQLARKNLKEKKFKKKLDELRSRTLTEGIRRTRLMQQDGQEASKFGDKLRTRTGVHEHEWSNPVSDPESGMQVKRCTECGLEVEEMEL